MARPLPTWHLEPPSGDSRILVFWKKAVLWPDPDAETPLFDYGSARGLGEFENPPLLIARWQGEDIYAAALKEPTAPVTSRELRAILTDSTPEVAALASTAQQLLHWQRDNRYCGRCGEATQLHDRERAMRCERCRHNHYPRLSPCVIVVIRRGDKVLLAQSQQYVGQFYSLIAGFVEAGESAEEAVHREVAEETGLEVTNLRYAESQSWAFPHQLMLGFIADYRAGELVLQEDELADARWFGPDDLPAIPGEWTIAGKLIRYGLASGGEVSR